MNRRLAYIEALGLAVVGCILVTSGILSLHSDLLNVIYPSTLWVERSAVVRSIMAIYGAVIVVAAVASFLLIRWHEITLFEKCLYFVRSVAQEFYETCKWFYATAQIKDAALWLMLMIAVGTAVRCYFLTQPMRYDEAYTFLNFVNRELINIFHYPLPNNHVLHTILVRISVEIFGSNPITIRLPALLAGLFVIPLTFGLSRLLAGSSRSGYLASACVVVFPYLVHYDTMARGYSLFVLLSLCLAVAVLRFVRYPSIRLCSLISIIMALGLLDMPSFLFPIAGILLWLFAILVQRRYEGRWIFTRVLLPCTVMTLGLTGVFYTPVIFTSNGINALADNRFVKGFPWLEFLTQVPSHLSEAGKDFIRDIPSVIIFGAVFLIVFGLYTLVRKRRWDAFLLLPALALGGAVVFFAKHAIPYPRLWLYVIPFIIILVDMGYAAIPNSDAMLLRAVHVVVAGFLAILLTRRATIAAYPDTGYFPEAPALVDVLSREMSPGDKVVARPPAEAPVHFYMWQQKIPQARNLADHAAGFRTFFVVKPSSYPLTDLTTDNTRKLFEAGDAALYVAELPDETKSHLKVRRPIRAVPSGT